jgi:Fe-S cluster assembly ATP-binding protein
MLSISHLSVSLGDTLILKDVSLTVETGTIQAVMGPNGSGKSTLAATLMGYPQYQVLSGSVLFKGEDLLTLAIEKRARAGLFLASQHTPSIPGVSVFTFLKEAHRMLTGEELSVSAFKELVYAAFDAVHLDHSFVYRFLNEGFSGGEKKRFEIAQLLLFKPQLVVLDEIDSGLDVDALHLITELLREEKKKNPLLTLIIITHYNRMLQALEPDRVHILARGKIQVSQGKELAHTIEQRGYDEWCL